MIIITKTILKLHDFEIITVLIINNNNSHVIIVITLSYVTLNLLITFVI